MQSTIITHHPDELIVKKVSSLYAFYGSLMFIILVPFTKHFLASFTVSDTKSLIAGSVVFLFMLGMTIGLWYNFFDRKPVLVINSSGIWTRKSEHVPWDRFVYYYFRQFKPKGKLTTVLYINTINPGEEYEIGITDFDKSYTEIINAIGINAQGFNVEYWGLVKEYNA